MSKEPYCVGQSPCTSCPYRRDVPAGVWHKSEYEKLRAYDDPKTLQDEIALVPFLCHYSPEIGRDNLCRGWLTVHAQSVAVRLLYMTGGVTEDQIFAEVAEPLYASGNEAADAGIRGIRRPGKKARKIIDKLAALGRTGPMNENLQAALIDARKGKFGPRLILPSGIAIATARMVEQNKIAGVFVRGDGWRLAFREDTEALACKTWDGYWVGVVRKRRDGSWEAIELEEGPT